MDRVDNIMERLGFKKDAEDSIKAAFVKNLIKQAYGVDVPVPPQYQAPPPAPKIEDLSADVFAGRPLPREPHSAKAKIAQENGQLSFNFSATHGDGEPAGEIAEPPKVG